MGSLRLVLRPGIWLLLAVFLAACTGPTAGIAPATPTSVPATASAVPTPLPTATAIPVTPTAPPIPTATAPAADKTPISVNATTTPQVTAGGADIPQAKLIPHPYEGQETCNACHSAGSPLHPMPATHEGRSNPTCITCHKPAGPKGTAPPVPSHGLGYDAEACLTCHAPDGPKPLPSSHAGRTLASCLICH